MINVILCTENIDLVAAFYAAVGIDLEPERHGNGPHHFSFRSDVCLEIYPPRIPSDSSMILRIDVNDIDQAMMALADTFKYGGLVVRGIESLSTGKKAIVKDPDGRIVELFQSFTP